MLYRFVILGGGTGGTIMANRLRRLYSPEAVDITVVDRDDAHVYQPGLLFVPFGLADAEHLVRPRQRQLHRDIAVRPGRDRPRRHRLQRRCISATAPSFPTTS